MIIKLNSTWQTKKLGEVADVHGGGTPPTSVAEYFQGNINWYSPKEIPKEGVAILDESQRKISESGQQFTTISGMNSVLLTSRATIGTVGILSTASGYSQGIKGIEPGPELDPWYLAHWLRSNKDEIINKASGTTFKEISTSEVKKLEIPLPPLAEQKKIVSSLEKILEKVEKAKENTEKNLQNSRDLFESYLQNIFINSGKNWEEKTLKNICEELFVGGDVPKNNFSKTKTEKYSVPIFANGVKDKGLYGFTDIERVKKSSITISARGTIGYSEVRQEIFFPVVRLIVLIPNKKIIDLFFLYYATRNFKFSNTGTSIPQLTIPMIEKIRIPLPPLSEQYQIVKKLDKLSEQTKKLEENYRKKLTSLDELKKSVLNETFTGKL